MAMGLTAVADMVHGAQYFNVQKSGGITSRARGPRPRGCFEKRIVYYTFN